MSGTIFGTIECEDRNKRRHAFFQGQAHLLERSSQKHTYFCDVVSFAPLLGWWGETGEGEALCIKTTLSFMTHGNQREMKLSDLDEMTFLRSLFLYTSPLLQGGAFDGRNG